MRASVLQDLDAFIAAAGSAESRPSDEATSAHKAAMLKVSHNTLFIAVGIVACGIIAVPPDRRPTAPPDPLVSRLTHMASDCTDARNAGAAGDTKQGGLDPSAFAAHGQMYTPGFGGPVLDDFDIYQYATSFFLLLLKLAGLVHFR